MKQKLTEADGRKALHEHVVETATAARRTYGDDLTGDGRLLELLEDRQVVRYPTELCFDGGPLRPGEFAHAQPLGERPADGFRLYVHPCFENRKDILPRLVVYHIVRINYGEIASHEDAELFGATLLGLDVEEYYRSLCDLADSLPDAGA